MTSLTAPQEAMVLYIEAFNKEDMQALNHLSSAPWVFVLGGRAKVFTKYTDAIDFPALREGALSANS